MDLRSVQKPLKERYRSEPGSSRITLAAKASQQDTAIACSVDIGRAVYEAQAHEGVGGAGTAACSGDLLLGALAACAQVTCQMVAEAMGIETESIEVEVEGDMDLAGTLGISRDVSVGFETITTKFHIVAPGASEEQLDNLRKKTEQYCVVFQTLAGSPDLHTEWA
ncbi:MAG: OsmC family protein [Rubrobacteraceae bacterium]